MTQTLSNIHPDLLHGLEAKDKKDFQSLALSNKDNKVLKQLKQAIARRLLTIASEEESNSSYNQVAWAYKQAHLNGNKQTLRWLDQLLGFVNA